MSYLMDYVIRSYGIKSDHVDIEKWPIITDDNFEASTFMVDESKLHNSHLIELIERNEVVSMGGFIGKTIDGLEEQHMNEVVRIEQLQISRYCYMGVMMQK